MNSTLITSFVLVGLLIASGPAFVQAGQRPRNPGGDSGGGSAGGSSGGGSTGSMAVPRGGGSSPWGEGAVSSRPSEPRSAPSSVGRRPARGDGRSSDGGAGTRTIPPYSRTRNGAPVTGYGVARGSIATLPPIISGPIYGGAGDWFFYPWGFGALGLGYLWDPMMWSGMYGGMYGGMGGWGGYPYVDPYWGGGGGGGGGYGSWDGGRGYDNQSGSGRDSSNPLDADGPTGGLRLKADPRHAEVHVDGFYAGRVDDFDGAMQKLKIVEGAHRIELRAEGYETATFSVNVVAGQTSTYRTALKPR